MQLLYRINRTGTTVVVATHDVDMVDHMRRRVIELVARPRRARRAGRRLRRARDDRRVRDPDAQDMRLGFFLREALRALRRNAVPSFAAMATVLVTVLVLGVFIPVVQATTGAANEVRGRVIADVYLRARRDRTATSRACATCSRTTRRTSRASSSSPRSRPTRSSGASNPEAYGVLGLQPAAGHVPRHARQPGQHRRDPRRAGAGGAGRRARGDRPGDRRGHQPRGGHEQDPLRHARGEADDGAAGRRCS